METVNNLDQIKEKLVEMRKDIIKEIELDNKQSIESVSMDVGDEADHASEEIQREFYRLLSNRQAKKLGQIDEALTRIEKEEYGRCRECGEPIMKKRLLVMPFTTLCTECQAELETNSGQSRAGESPFDSNTVDEEGI